MTVDKRVPPIGPTPAKWMIIGESPGRQEVQEGKPFVGGSGRMLSTVLASIGRRRSLCYITNTSKYRPPSKDKDAWFAQRRRAFQEELAEEIREVQPKTIIVLGSHAYKALVPNGPSITKARGSWYIEEISGLGIPTMASLHPAWFMRGMQNKIPLLYWDFAKWGRGFVEPVGEFTIGPRSDRIDELMPEIMALDEMVIDTEWYSPNELAYLGVAIGTEKAAVFHAQMRSQHRAIEEILRSPTKKVWQNGMFDVVALMRHGFEVNGLHEDTLVGFHSLYPDLAQKDLGTLGSVYTNWPYFKDEVEFVGSNDALGMEYNAKDCVVTAEAWDGIKADLKREGCQRSYDISMSIFDTMARASALGIRVSEFKFLKTREKYEKEASKLQLGLESVIGYKLNVNSPQQVAALIYDGLKAKGTTRSTNQAVLMEIAAKSKDPVLQTILTAIIRIRQNRKVVSSFLSDKVLGPDGRATTSWNLAGTRSGRLSSTKPWWAGLPLQTVPIEARGIFVPDKGMAFFGWDLRQAEARYVAALSRDFELIEAMDNGIDIHCLLGSKLPFNMTYEQFMEKKAAEGGDFIERFLSKKGKHTKNYRGTWYALMKSINREYLDTGIGITAAEAKKLDKEISDLSPNLEVWWDQVRGEYNMLGGMTNAFGRRRRFSLAGPFTEKLWGEMISWEPQSAIADVTTQTIARIDEALDYGAKGQILGHFHDGGMGQCRVEDKDMIEAIIAEAVDIPFVVNRMEMTIPHDFKWSEESWADL